jgi:hypothetical protein
MTSVVTNVVGVSLFDPWQQKELMLAQLRVSRARTEAGQDKALKASSALHDKFLASNAAALAKEAQAKKKLLEAEAKALLEAKMMVELVARFSKEEDEDSEKDLEYWWNQMEHISCL